MGAWIEITVSIGDYGDDAVAPYMGAWIEIVKIQLFKSMKAVAPYMGAWIEMSRKFVNTYSVPGRSLHGSVD